MPKFSGLYENPEIRKSKKLLYRCAHPLFPTSFNCLSPGEVSDVPPTLANVSPSVSRQQVVRGGGIVKKTPEEKPGCYIRPPEKSPWGIRTVRFYVTSRAAWTCHHDYGIVIKCLQSSLWVIQRKKKRNQSFKDYKKLFSPLSCDAIIMHD